MPTMTAMVDRLETANMVKRERDSDDRRVVQVRLTAGGKKELEKLVHIRRDEMEKILMNLTETEMNTFLVSIETVAHYLRRPAIKEIWANNMLKVSVNSIISLAGVQT